MKRTKSLWCMAFGLVLFVALYLPSLAAIEDTGYADVEASDWYAEAAAYCREHKWMGGTSQTAFSPHDAMSRAMLVTVLYRMADTPVVSGANSFPDAREGIWYRDAALWAGQTQVINGYADGRFGPDDPVSREQLAAILWRFEGSPAARAETAFADVGDIAPWATEAVDWVLAESLMNGKPGNRFDPKGSATRAEVAMILMRYAQRQAAAPDTTPVPDESSRILIAYFSRSGNTETVAGFIQQATGGELFRIATAEPYPEDYNAVLEQAQQELNQNARPALAGSVDHMIDYDVIFLGYPIWYGDAPRAICSFLESCDMSGKTIIPFATSGGSGMDTSIQTIRSLCPDSVVREGLLIAGSSAAASQSRVVSWIEGLELDGLPYEKKQEGSTLPQLQLTLGSRRLMITLRNNATARDLISRLPVTLTFEDYAGAEKIAYLPGESLTSQDAPSSYDPGVGDLCLYAPWGNLCFFYKDSGPAGELIPIGSVEGDDIQILAAQNEEFSATLEVSK